MGAALTLLVTGLALTHDRLGSFDPFGAGTDGKLIFAKTVIFAAVFVLAAIHGLVMGPRIRELRRESLAAPDDSELAAALHTARSSASGASRRS